MVYSPHMIGKTTAPALLEQLQRALIRREVRNGFELLDRAFARTTKLDFLAPYSISLLLAVAQWVDLGYRSPQFLESLMVGLPNRAHLSVMDFLKLRLTEAYRDLAQDQLQLCVDGLDLILQVGDDLLGDYLLFLTTFWKGRAHRKRGVYEQAHRHLGLARAAAERARAPKLVAVTKIHQGWLAFQNGDRTYALQLLDEAESVLRSTGHALSLGNIESARGRFVRRSGEYTRALGHFENAIAIFSRNYPEHPNLARALVNAAYVKRLIALDLRPKSSGGKASGATHDRSLRITQDALALLDRAGSIYALHHHQAGTGSVFVNSAYLHLDNGSFDEAAIEAQRGFDLGQEKADLILMARSRMVQSSVEVAHADEQLGEQPDVALHANLAVKHADEAIQLALQTQNKRLLAEAYITRGMTAAIDYLQEWDVAKEYLAKSSALLNKDDRDHLYKVLGDLRVKLATVTRIDETLRLWSEGQLGDKTFQQVQEEFAELVIPKVWLRSGKNVTAVSKRLRISPKKVRRILRNTKRDLS